MNLRTSIIKHPSGVDIETPLFVPSYSSKGFILERDNRGKLKSEVCKAIELANQFLTESQLISAYDVYYNYLLQPVDLIPTKIIFVDSGGYETSSSFDFSETRRSNNNHEKWNIEYLKKVLTNWPRERFPTVIVSFDDENDRKPVLKQIESAKQLFKEFDNCLHDFLIKPETKTSNFINIENLIKNINRLKNFNIIGITEKELGNSILQRMQRIQKIRNELDKARINAPIHIFGSLDPITIILYFMAGAEIFDGLTWLKYSYFSGLAMYTNNLSVLDKEMDINTSDSKVKARSISNNLYFLEKLKSILINFKNSNNDFKLFDELGFNGLGKIIENNYIIFKNRRNL